MLAATEAQAMNYNFVGTEHLLLAILREGESAAARILQNLNVNLDEVRQAVSKTLDSDYLPENNDDQSEPPNLPPQQPERPGRNAAEQARRG